MNSYPINISSKAVHALVIGAGAVGLRKVETLLQQGVEDIRVIDLYKEEKDFPYKDIIYIKYFQKEYEHSDLAGFVDKPPCNLVFAATSDKELNAEIAKECNKRNIFCNVISNPTDGSFTLPALVQKKDILFTLSTNGLSPALSRVLKEDVEAFLENGYDELCNFLGRLRPKILALEYTSEKNAEIFRTFLTAPYKEVFLEFFAERNEINTKKVKELIKTLFSREVQILIEVALC